MKYENQSLCKACGGYCCKNSPCYFTPEDFPDLSLNGLLKEFRGKDYLCIVSNDIPYISVRAKHWKRVVQLIETWIPAPCLLWSSTGCAFSYDERPTGGKLLVPTPNHDCYSKLDSKSFIEAWTPHTEVLLQVMTHL